jgi:hypothetical protein
MMRWLTPAEYDVVVMLIADAEAAITDMTRVLREDEQAVREVRAARDWLRGIRDTRMVSVVIAERDVTATPGSDHPS